MKSNFIFCLNKYNRKSKGKLSDETRNALVVKIQSFWSNLDEKYVKPLLIHDWPNVKLVHRDITKKIQDVHSKMNKINKSFLSNQSSID